MSYENAYPLRQIASLPLDQVQKLYSALMALIVRLAQVGLIHGDFNEFNLLVKEMNPESDEEGSDVASSDTSDNADVMPERDEEREDQGDEEEELDEMEDEAVVLNDGVQVEPILIDFPQMVSIEHPNAEYYFARDVECVRRFFRRRFRFESEEYPTFDEAIAVMQEDSTRLDALTHASGYGKITADEEALSSVRILTDTAIALLGYGTPRRGRRGEYNE